MRHSQSVRKLICVQLAPFVELDWCVRTDSLQTVCSLNAVQVQPQKREFLSKHKIARRSAGGIQHRRLIRSKIKFFSKISEDRMANTRASELQLASRKASRNCAHITVGREKLASINRWSVRVRFGYFSRLVLSWKQTERRLNSLQTATLRQNPLETIRKVSNLESPSPRESTADGWTIRTLQDTLARLTSQCG